MTLYWFVFIILLYNAFSKKKSNETLYVASAVALFLIGFLRTETVGADVLDYCDFFKQLKLDLSVQENLLSLNLGSEAGFVYFSMFLKHFISNPLTYIHIVFLVYYSFIIISIRRLSINKPLTLFLYYSLAFYFFSFNGIRQAFALSIVMLIVSYIPQQKLSFKVMILYIIIILLTGYLFHKSLIIACLIPLLIKYKDSIIMSNKNLIITIVVCAILSKVFIAPIASTLSGIDISILNSDMYSGYVAGLEAKSSFSYLSNFLHAFFAIFVLITSKENNNAWIKVYAIGVAFFVLLSPLNWLFIRLTDNLRFFIIFAIPAFVKDWNLLKFKKLFITAIFLYCTVLFWNRLKDDNYQDVVPYHSVLCLTENL